jgi:omega-hydroxy-beta-dihydromenaquinone-9 sulfotransferase
MTDHPLVPIFIVGCPRSGTTLLLDVLAAHEELAWVSGIVNVWPDRPILGTLNRIYDGPGGERLYRARVQARYRALPRPVEPWDFWRHHLSGFRPHEARNPTPADLCAGEADAARAAVKRLCRAQGKPRFISKYTDFPRIAYIRTIFPDARFIHIVRDGRAVAYSYVRAIEGGSFGTWAERDWWMQAWPAAWREEWRTFGNPLAFVAYQWKFFVGAIREEAQRSGAPYLEVSYQSVVGDPDEMLNQVLPFCDLPQSPRIESVLETLPTPNHNSQWKDRLNEGQRRMLEQIITEPTLQQTFDAQ